MMKTIRGKLIATISVVCAIVISFVIFISAYVSENIVMDKSKQQMTLLAEKYSSQVAGWLDKQVTNTESLAVFVEVNQKTDADNLRKAALSLFQFQSDEILEIYYGMEDKTIVMGSGGALPDGYDCTVRGWYTAAKTAGKTIITDPYVDAFTGKMVVSVAVPIYIDGKFAGVAGADILIAQLVDLIGGIDFENESYGFLLDSANNYVVHKNEDYLPTKDSTTNISSTKELNVLEDAMGNGVQTVNATDYDGVDKYFVISPVSVCDWTLGVAIPQSLIVSEIVRITIISVILAIAGLGCIVITIYIMVTKVLRPIKYLKEIAQKVSNGEVNLEVTRTAGDEFGQLQDAFAVMVDNIKIQTEIVEEVAAGNLTVPVHPRSDQDAMGTALSRLVVDNNRILSNIMTVSNLVGRGAKEVEKGSQDLAQGSTEQASAIEQITASIAEIANQTKKNSEDANEARNLVSKTKSSAQQSGTQMQDMIEAMNAINSSSENISTIIKAIDSIAFETNILALNAAVEAARAGEHGKGFAVVADEVRNLANKSASAAKETAELIEDSIKKIKTGFNFAENTAESLEEIISMVSETADIVENIALASTNQVTAVTQIDLAIGQVSQVVQRNSATSEESASASMSLLQEAENLKALLMKFKLKNNII